MKLMSMLLGAAVLICACSATVDRPVRVDASDDALLITLVQLAIDDLNRNGLPGSVYFLEVQGRDPSPELLGKLPTFSVPVRKLSSSKQFAEPFGEYRIVDATTGAIGSVVSVAVGVRLSSTEVEASYGWRQARLASRMISGKLKQVGGKWVVTEVLYDVQS